MRYLPAGLSFLMFRGRDVVGRDAVAENRERAHRIERNLETTRWPKMDITNCRSMELLRRLRQRIRDLRREIVKRLQEESLKALRSNAVTERFVNDSALGGGGPPEEFAAFIRADKATDSPEKGSAASGRVRC